MKSLRGFTIATALLLLITVAAHLAGEAIGKQVIAPRVDLPDGLNLDLGTVDRDQRATGSFRIVNRGLAPLRYELLASCGCTDLSPSSGVVAPLSTETVSITLTPQPNGEYRHVSVVVATNDAARAFQALDVNLKSFARVVIKEKSLDFGEVTLGQPRTRDVFLSDSAGSALKSFEGLRVHATSPHLLAEFVPETSQLRVELRSDAPPGFLNGVVRIVSSKDDRALTSVNAHAWVRTPIAVAPPRVRLVPAEDGALRASFIVISDESQPLGDCGKPISDNGAFNISKWTSDAISPTRRSMTVWLHPISDGGDAPSREPIQDRLILSFSEARSEATVTVIAPNGFR